MTIRAFQNIEFEYPSHQRCPLVVPLPSGFFGLSPGMGAGRHGFGGRARDNLRARHFAAVVPAVGTITSALNGNDIAAARRE